MPPTVVPGLPCADLQSAIDFWGMLGFEPVPESGDGTDFRHPSGFEIRLISDGADRRVAAATVRFDSAILVDRLFDPWLSIGHPGIGTPTDTTDGFRRGNVSDLDGNSLTIEGPIVARPTWTGFYIDTPSASDTDIVFWTMALGRDVASDDGTYVVLGGSGFDVEIQRIGDPRPRFHIDFSVDDVDEAADRFESYGAVRIDRIDGWWVMRAPTGHTFCLVPR